MTPTEMQNYFLTELKVRDHARLGSDDIFYFLNKAQEQWLLQRFENSRAFERTQSLIDDTRVFRTNNNELNAQYAGNWNGYEVDYVDLPNDYLHVVEQSSKVDYNPNGISYTVTGGKRVADNSQKSAIYYNRIDEEERVDRLLDDPFNTTKHLSPLTNITDSRINVYTNDYFLVDKVYLDYLRKPQKIDPENNQSSEIPDIYHKELVQQAVALYSQFSSPSGNSQSQEQENED